MSDTDPYAEALGDWRSHGVFWVTAFGDHKLPAPLAGQQVSHFEEEGVSLSFHTPSAAALHLNAAWRAASVAVDLKRRVAWNDRIVFPGWGIGGFASRQIRPESVSTLFDYFEAAMAAANGSFAAVEAFCNVTIVEKLRGKMEVLRREKRVSMSALEIEEQVSTSQKVRAVLPQLLGCESLQVAECWDAFEHLRQLRDSITHFKRRDQARSQGSEPTALHSLATLDPFELPECAMAVVRHFSGETPPRWLLNPAWVRPGAPASAGDGAERQAAVAGQLQSS